MKKYLLALLAMGIVFLSVGCTQNDPMEDTWTQNIYPASDSTYDIGSPSLAYAEGYFDDIFCRNLSASGTINVALDTVYSIVDSCFNYSGKAYISDPVLVGFTGSLWFTGSDVTPLVFGGADFSAIDGTTDVAIGLYNISLGGDVYLTVYYMAGQKANLETWMDGAVGVGMWSCDATYASGFTPIASIYAFNGYPIGWTLSPTYPTPEVTSTSTYTTQLKPDGNVSVGTDLDVTYNTTIGRNLQVTGAKLLLGSAAVPFIVDYCLQGFKAISNSGGNVAGMLFGLQEGSAVDVPDQLWGIDTGLALYGNCNYTSNVYGLQSMARIDINDHLVNILNMMDARFTMSGGSYPNTESNVGVLNMYNMQTSREGGSADSRTSYMYGLHDSTNFDWVVDNWFGVYLANHSAAATNSWGLYNLDRTYLGGAIVLSTGEIQPVTRANASVANNSIFVDSATGNLSYKDSSGITHMFAWQ